MVVTNLDVVSVVGVVVGDGGLDGGLDGRLDAVNSSQIPHRRQSGESSTIGKPVADLNKIHQINEIQYKEFGEV